MSYKKFYCDHCGKSFIEVPCCCNHYGCNHQESDIGYGYHKMEMKWNDTEAELDLCEDCCDKLDDLMLEFLNNFIKKE